jgi:hypothetical protein
MSITGPKYIKSPKLSIPDAEKTLKLRTPRIRSSAPRFSRIKDLLKK